MGFKYSDTDRKYGRQSGPRDRTKEKEGSLLGRYYTAIENLVLFLFSRSTYLTTLRTMVRDEVDYRVGLIIKGAILLTLSLFFLFSAMAYLAIALLFSLQRFTGDWVVSAGILFTLFLAIFVILLFLARDLLRRLTEKRPRSGRLP